MPLSARTHSHLDEHRSTQRMLLTKLLSQLNFAPWNQLSVPMLDMISSYLAYDFAQVCVSAFGNCFCIARVSLCDSKLA
jgi:hypothetical protein